MSNGEIPINPGDLPTDTVLLEESGVYPATLEKGAISMKLANPKNYPLLKNVVYCSINVTVTEGDFEGQTLITNYLPLPRYADDDAKKAERIQALNISAQFGRFCRSFKITTPIPPVRNLNDPEKIRAWQDWLEKYYGNIGKVTVRNQEYPEGSGRQRSGLSDFVF